MESRSFGKSWSRVLREFSNMMDCLPFSSLESLRRNICFGVSVSIACREGCGTIALFVCPFRFVRIRFFRGVSFRLLGTLREIRLPKRFGFAWRERWLGIEVLGSLFGACRGAFGKRICIELSSTSRIASRGAMDRKEQWRCWMGLAIKLYLKSEASNLIASNLPNIEV